MVPGAQCPSGGASLRIAHSTVGEYIQRAEQAGLDWDQVQAMDEADLQRKLFPPKQPDPKQRPEPDWLQVEKDLQRKGFTRMLLWQEYLTEHPDGYGYSQFCERYRQWRKAQQKVTLRIPKKAGEEAQVDYAGLTMTVTDSQNGEEHEVQIFVGVPGASGLIYAEAHPSQSLPHWARAHVRMFQFFGGTPRIIRLDNLLSHIPHPLIASWNNFANSGFGIDFCKDHTTEFKKITLILCLIANCCTHTLWLKVSK